MTHSCPGCQYDQERRQERLGRRRQRQQNQKGKQKQKEGAPTIDETPDEDFEDEWETDDGENNADEDYMDMVDAFMSRAFLYSKAMKEVIAMDRDKGKQIAKTLAKVGSASKFASERSKEKKEEEAKKKTKQVNNKEKAGAESRSLRTEGDRSGKKRAVKEHWSGAGSSTSAAAGGSYSPAGQAILRQLGLDIPQPKYSLDDTD